MVITNLHGNGTDYVLSSRGMEIPFELRNVNGTNPLPGNVVNWNSASRSFELSTEVPSGVYEKGRITVGGVTWSVVTASASQVTVAETHGLPFLFVDDDQVVVPFRLNPGLLQASDQAASNLLAQAYIRPAYDIENKRPAVPFVRNISTPPRGASRDYSDVVATVRAGRDSANGSSGYWAGYAQAAYQGDEVVDDDPGAEVSHLGDTIDDDLSFIHAEAIAEQAEQWRWAGEEAVAQVRERCRLQVLAHEVGHQLGLGDPSPLEERDGVMLPGCGAAHQFYMGDELDVMRWKGVTR